MRTKTVLVVDDELDMRIFISTLLETAGYRPITTRDGRDGVAKAQQSTPDLIVMDVMMPGEGGVQMYRKLKTCPELAAIPVIMLSAVTRDCFFHYLNMLNTGLSTPIPRPSAYLEKPVDPERLLSAVQSILPLR